MDRHSSTRKATRKGTSLEYEGLWDWNLVSNRIHFSPGWIALTGCQDHEVGTTPDDWLRRVHPEDADRLARDLEAARADDRCEFELRYRLRHKDGTYRWMESHGLVVRDGAGAAIRLTGTQSDVTVETVTDRLTGLPNRLLLLDRLAQSIARAQRHPTFQFALLLLDLGRPLGPVPRSRSGDPLLNAAARRLETCLRMPELLPDQRRSDLVARVDGHVLAVLLDGVADLSHARLVGDRLLAEMLTPFSLGSTEVRLSPAIGIALSATGYTQPDTALRDAETALHRAHVLGGSHCEVFDAAVLESEESDQQLEDDFEGALQRGEFEVAYQPIVSIASRQVVGFEALARWRHPVLGSISPAEFIPIAERTGFIVPLGQWILRDACARLRAWQSSLPSAHDVWVSVNLSGVQVRHPDLLGQVEEALADSGLPARGLVLELTEGTAMENPAAVTTVLMRLRALGIRISIDDFGTGYSSLACLRQLPVDALKIDQSFVRRMETDKDTVAIVASMVAMARQLHLHVVAEGIESRSQLALLGSLQCDSVQGFLFGRALEPGAAEELLAAGLPPDPEPDAAAGAAGAGAWREWRRPGARGLVMAGAILAVIASAGIAALWPSRQAAVPSPAAPPAREQAGPSEPPPPGAASGAPAGRGTTAAAAAATPAAVAPSTPRASARRSFAVVHLHRFGSCRGLLRVSDGTLAYVPDDDDGGDAVTLKAGEFEHELAGDTVTIRSADRTYRFRIAPGSPRAHTAPELARTVSAIAGPRSR